MRIKKGSITHSLIIISLIFFISIAYTLLSWSANKDNVISDNRETSNYEKIKKKIIKVPGKTFDYIKKKEWYKQEKKDKKLKREIITTQDEANLSSIQEGASDDINTIFVLVGEIPIDDDFLIAPIFMTDHKNIFGTKTDLAFKWVGLKGTLRFKQRGFPWNKTELSEIFIGSFLYASGTNIGFSGGARKEEIRFYTHYTSQIVSLKCKLPYHLATAFTLDSRQYFFVKREPPIGFIMPTDHINFFPRLDFILENITEKGIDQLTSGVGFMSWIGYGIRNKWEKWGGGDVPYMESGKWARTFVIYSITLTSGLLFYNNHNIVLRTRYKGGVDNDFLTRPRFGATIDNAKLDVVHGFSLDKFRVEEFGLINIKYSFNIARRVRMSLFFDYAHVFNRPDEDEDSSKDIFGTGYGFRILSFGGLPIWITHGIGKKRYPGWEPTEHVVMILTAAGW